MPQEAHDCLQTVHQVVFDTLWEALLKYCIMLDIEEVRFRAKDVEKFLNREGVYLVKINDATVQKVVLE